MRKSKETTKIELGSSSPKLSNIVNNADYRNTRKITDGFAVHFDNFVYYLYRAKLNYFQNSKLTILTKEKEAEMA